MSVKCHSCVDHLMPCGLDAASPLEKIIKQTAGFIEAHHIHSDVCEVPRNCVAPVLSSLEPKAMFSLDAGDKPHVCSTCGKAYADRHRLKIHEYNHMDQKPHVCNVCGKSFGTNTRLKLHMRHHSGQCEALRRCALLQVHTSTFWPRG